MLKAWRITRRHCAREAQISRRQHHQMQNGGGCSTRTPRDSKRGISFHRLPLKNKPFLKKGLMPIKEVRANCFCASLLRMQIHATSSMSERALSIKINNDREDGHCCSFARIWRSWTFGDPYFSFKEQILFTIISTLSKNEQKVNVGS